MTSRVPRPPWPLSAPAAAVWMDFWLTAAEDMARYDRRLLAEHAEAVAEFAAITRIINALAEPDIGRTGCSRWA